MDAGDWVPIVIPTAFFVAVAVISHAIIQARGRTEATRLEVHSRLIERVGSAREFGEFLATDAGERFLKALAPPSAHPSSPQWRLVWGIRAGMIASAVGIGLFIARNENVLPTEGEDVAILATLSLAAGLGMLASALVSFLLARRLGLTQQTGPSTGSADTVSR